MSIIMQGVNSSVESVIAPIDTDQSDLLRDFLDHIAVELAHEYMRLMEEAAAVEAGSDRERT